MTNYPVYLFVYLPFVFWLKFIYSSEMMHVLCLGGSPGADFLGAMMIGLAQELMLFLMTPTHSNVLICC